GRGGGSGGSKPIGWAVRERAPPLRPPAAGVPSPNLAPAAPVRGSRYSASGRRSRPAVATRLPSTWRIRDAAPAGRAVTGRGTRTGLELATATIVRPTDHS